MLADKVYNLASFLRQYEALITLSVCEAIPNLQWLTTKEFLLKQIDWNNLLGISSILCFSDKNEHLDAALRIAQTCIILDRSKEQKFAAAIILENLTNNPALKLAIERALVDATYKEQVPLPFLLQTTKTNIENSITVNNELLQLNKFQKKVHTTHESFEVISISAPTSAGKSFILSHIVIEELLKKPSTVIYIVPTRALINQVEDDFRQLTKKYQLLNVNISTVPQVEKTANSNIFIFTQERLHWFLLENSSMKIDYLIVDEAQKIDDGNRGILLQQKIEEVIQLNPDIKVYFSSPFTSNPELLLENVNGNSSKQIVDTQFIAVNQNLLYINQVPRKVDKYLVKLTLTNKTINLGTISLKDRPGNSDLKKLAFVSEAFSANKGGNLIYSNGSAQAEKFAQIVFDLLPSVDISTKTAELIKLIKKTIHRDYSLAKVLEKGIAFHYGNMPLLIRQEIEQLFKEGDIKYLICTSTLLEGVNLPSKSIFIRRPTRGKDHPLTENDFWNLAGRAGRWGKEFSGNIICIDPHDWEIPPNPTKNKQKIIRAVDKIKESPDELIKYIQDGSPREIVNTRQDLEFAFGYFYIKFLNREIALDTVLGQKLTELFEPLSKKIIIPDYIIKRNPGISPLSQQMLFEYFSTEAGDIESLLPLYPEDENAYEGYVNLVGRIGKTLSYYPSQLDRSRAILLINWMRGRPLSYLISSSYSNYQANEKFRDAKPLPVVIRETMDNVENFVRFRFAKDSSCYVDVLRYFLELNRKPDLIERIPELSLWLEFGVSQKTHLSLLSLGLSRSTVIELSEFITNSQMNKEECLQWIRDSNFELLELSPIIKDNIRKVL